MPRSSGEVSFRIEYADARREPALAGAVLLEIRFGERAPAASASRDGTLVVRAPLEPLGERCVERWFVGGGPERSREPVIERVREHGFELAACGDLLAGAADAPGDDVEHDTRSLYARMLALVAERGFHLQRVWNVVPRLGERIGALDRYMLFCRARAETFERAWGAEFASRLCAFSAVGSRRGPQLLHFLASRDSGRPRENPRQVPAWLYPERYGPRSPSFARAHRAPAALGNLLFVSGTASIVGHESRHAGDVLAQTRETLANLRALLEPGGAADPGVLARVGPVKVYVASRGDRARVAETLGRALPPGTPVLWLEADLCRPELAVEIECVAPPRSGAPLVADATTVHAKEK